MGDDDRSAAPGPGDVVDSATLLLCRQGRRWIVVVDSPHRTRAVRLRHIGDDADGARFDLLSRIRRACPDASIITIEGAVEGADDEWRLEVRGIEGQPGDLGWAIHRALTSPAPPTHPPRSRPRRAARHCGHGLSPTTPGRPRSF
jgi:hypothetical protein